ncbi:Mss4-like protein [Mycena latifolia]|nr:Mss4-like protein [Mycena latifolia]
MHSKSYIPLAGSATDGWSNDDEATATCFCGAVQLKFGPGLVETFICNCFDCRKITASMFASNFTVADTHLTHLRGRENLTAFSHSGFPGMSILRIGTIDDFYLHETKLKPQVEQFIENRVGWLHGAEGVKQVEGSIWEPRNQ